MCVYVLKTLALKYLTIVMGGRGKRRIGRIHKNSEKKRQALKVNKRGRPSKVKRHSSCIENLKTLDETVSPSLSNRWSRRLHNDDYIEYIKLSPQGPKGMYGNYSLIKSEQ